MLVKFHSKLKEMKMIENDSYELMGKFFPGEGGLLFETRFIENMKGVLSWPFLQTLELIQNEFDTDP